MPNSRIGYFIGKCFIFIRIVLYRFSGTARASGNFGWNRYKNCVQAALKQRVRSCGERGLFRIGDDRIAWRSDRRRSVHRPRVDLREGVSCCEQEK